MSDIENMINIQLRTGISVAVALGVSHISYVGNTMGQVEHHVENIVWLLRRDSDITISDPDNVLNTGPGVQLGTTSQRRIPRLDYAQAVQLLGAQTIDVMRQILVKT